MTQSSMKISIRNFQQEDMPLLGELYQAVTANQNALFWWIGDEENWSNVFCAFENGRMIAKGQVSIINVVPPDRSAESTHSIYVNLKTVPEREKDSELLNQVYQRLLTRAQELAQCLPPEYKTLLCVGNDSSEIANNEFFTQQGFHPLNSLYCMSRDLTKPIAEMQLHEEFILSHWKMKTAEEEEEYLEVEAEIWPDTPLGRERLAEYKNHKLWTSMILRHEGTLVGGLMAWKEDDHGVIEDVFIREPWRKRGLAKVLLNQALHYLCFHGLESTNLMVLTTNQSALSLYESVGFVVAKEEIRYYIPLD